MFVMQFSEQVSAMYMYFGDTTINLNIENVD